MTTDERIDRLIDLTARAESGGRYDAWTPDDQGAGVSCGLIQFNQRRGSLFALISCFEDANPALAYKLAPQLHPLNEARFKSMNLNATIFKSQLLELLREPTFQAIQRKFARNTYFDPAAKLCAKFGLVSERAHAMAFDVAVQYGVGGLREMLSKTLNLTYDPVEEPSFQRHQLNWLAEWADTHEYDANRRHKLLQSRELSDEPMFPAPVSETPTETRPTLRHWDSKGPEVIALQEALIALGYYSGPTYPRFGDATRAAVENFQAAHGLVVDGIVGEKTWRALDQAAKEGGKP